MKSIGTFTLLSAMAVGTLALAQDNFEQQNPPASSQNSAPGWHRFGERVQDPASAPQSAAPQQAQPPREYPMPSSLTLPAGSWITVRVNQPLSSDRNRPGDAFTASLVEPIVVQGLVVARRGQTIGGRVSQTTNAGRVKGSSTLGVELTEVSLVDGQQVPVKTQLMERRGNTSVGRDVAAVGATTGLGALIGAAAGGGWGAGIGALAGAAVGTTGVLATRGEPTVIYPETVLTFRLEQPVTITSQAMQAFQPAAQDEYDRPDRDRPAMRYNAPPPAYRNPYPAAVTPYYPYYPSFGLSFYSGPGYFYGRGYYGRHRW